MVRISACSLLLSLLVSLPLTAQTPTASDADITKQIRGLRAVPDAERGHQTNLIAMEIRALPASQRKVQLAVGLAHLSTEGDPGRENLQAVTTTLAQALTETPQPAEKGKPAEPYVELASLVRYEGMTADIDAPQFKKAAEALAAEDAEVAKADFTLYDIHNKKQTLSKLRGKIVVVNFWATWCPPCRKELPDLNAIEAHYASQGLEVLAITDEELIKVNTMFGNSKPAFDILFDPGRKVENEFHVEGIPRTFVFDRDGKLVAESMDMRTQRQFLLMLQKAGLKL
ncbi:MAG TPA: TlpA disulfide reductase family protein [Acidobacteriaceae bacterium]|jgi:thiol-disulfide isomerase/thioredoxin